MIGTSQAMQVVYKNIAKIHLAAGAAVKKHAFALAGKAADILPLGNVFAVDVKGSDIAFLINFDGDLCISTTSHAHVHAHAHVASTLVAGVAVQVNTRVGELQTIGVAVAVAVQLVGAEIDVHAHGCGPVHLEIQRGPLGEIVDHLAKHGAAAAAGINTFLKTP